MKNNSPLKKGYKQTEAGVIPEEWGTPRVGDVCGCIVPGRNKPKLFDGDIPWITTPDLEDGKPVTTSKLGLCISRSEAKAVGSKVVPHGSVLMSCAGELGLVALTQNEIVVNQQLHVFLPTARIDSTFLLNTLSYRKGQIASLGTKTAVPYLNKSSCNSILIPLPPPPEQRAIAEVLNDVDALLGALNRLIAKKRDIKQAAMQWFLTPPDSKPIENEKLKIESEDSSTNSQFSILHSQLKGRRLPGFSEKWEVKRLGDVAEIVMGQSPSSSNYNTSGVGLPLIQGNADIDNRKTIKRIFTTQITKRGKSGDTLMSVRAPVGEISRAMFDVCLGRGVCAIRFENDFMYHCLIYLEPTWAKHSKGSTFDSVNSADVKSLEIHMPAIPAEQTAIAAILSDMDAELAALEQRREKTRALKQGMMQELLTGRIRLL
jgi:type I restriction enzyme S subunit